MIYALDTNIISYLFRGKEETRKHFEQEIVQSDNSYVIPPVVVYELQRWLHDNPTPKLLAFAKVFEELYQSVRDNAEMTAASWEKAAELFITLKQKGQLIEEADILIAAYCIVNDYTLVTNNIRHFEKVLGLKYVNWC
jgi:tRNA(fMet)-specific endonuclease VapC